MDKSRGNARPFGKLVRARLFITANDVWRSSFSDGDHRSSARGAECVPTTFPHQPCKQPSFSRIRTNSYLLSNQAKVEAATCSNESIYYLSYTSIDRSIEIRKLAQGREELPKRLNRARTRPKIYEDLFTSLERDLHV